MTKIGSLLAALTLALPACGSVAGRGDEADRPPSNRDTEGASSEQAAMIERDAAIYAAVIRQLVTKDHTFGSGPSPFDHVYVLDGVIADAGSPRMPAYQEVGRPFRPILKRSILARLADLPKIEFVRGSRRVVIDEDDCPRVRGEGVLLSLGPISGSERRVTVANSLFFACLGGQWLTYVLEPAAGDWRVVGTKGPVAVS
jgi:hypothetical protein